MQILQTIYKLCMVSFDAGYALGFQVGEKPLICKVLPFFIQFAGPIIAVYPRGILRQILSGPERARAYFS